MDAYVKYGIDDPNCRLSTHHSRPCLALCRRVDAAVGVISRDARVLRIEHTASVTASAVFINMGKWASGNVVLHFS